MKELAFDVIALGHTHRAYTRNQDKQIIFNPGSVGQARDTEGLVCAKILDTKTKELDVIQEPYDFMTTINNSISYGAKDWVYKHFKTII